MISGGGGTTPIAVLCHGYQGNTCWVGILVYSVSMCLFLSGDAWDKGSNGEQDPDHDPIPLQDLLAALP